MTSPSTNPLPSPKRFVVIGGPGGRLSCRPVGRPMLTDRYRRWQLLVRVNRPLTPARVDAAQRAALRLYTVA
jgi:hypothetical protein